MPRLRRTTFRPRRPLSPRRLAAGGAAVLMAWVAYSVVTEIGTGQAVDSRVRQLQSDNDRLRQQIGEKRTEIAAAQSKAWVEEEARKLGFVRPGERVYVVQSPNAAIPPDAGLAVPSLPSYAPTPRPGGTPAPAPTDAFAAPSTPPTPFVFAVPTPAGR